WVACDHSIDFDNRIKGMYKLVGSKLRPIDGVFDQLDHSVKRRWRDRRDYRPDNLKAVFGEELDSWSK
ncbi:MAG: DUF2235 domain-containing protein, partial [Cyanothece sp. SIO1E1]|nr:DUF2235 domain-containing protein [Cyanothece sp. SIO1E1]